VGFIKIKDVFPLWAVVAIVGTILAFAMLILTEHHTKPRYHSVVEKKTLSSLFLLFNQFVGFCISWFYCICGLDLFNCK
jgi:ABC-type Mn2+/Zn2+ transport system permease subunit